MPCISTIKGSSAFLFHRTVDHLLPSIFRKINVSSIIALFSTLHTGKGNLNTEGRMLQIYRNNGINFTCWKANSISFLDEKRPNFQRGIILGFASGLLPASTPCETIYTQRSVLLYGKKPYCRVQLPVRITISHHFFMLANFLWITYTRRNLTGSAVNLHSFSPVT